MSLSAKSLSRKEKKKCPECGKPALYCTKRDKHLRTRPDHDLCLDCWERLKKNADAKKQGEGR